jgi:hypothetical protein
LGSFYREGWLVWFGQQKLTNLDKKYLYKVIHGPRVQDWWVRNGRLQEEALPRIDWDIIGPALQTMQSPRRRWLTKHVLANCGVGETLVKWGIQVDLDCP